MSKNRRTGISILIGALLVFVVGTRLHDAVGRHQQLYGKPRREWKDAAIRTLSQQAADSSWLTHEKAALESRIADSGTEAATTRWQVVLLHLPFLHPDGHVGGVEPTPT